MTTGTRLKTRLSTFLSAVREWLPRLSEKPTKPIRRVASLLGVMLLSSLCLMPMTAHSGQRTMLELLKVLRDNGTISQEAYDVLYKTALEETDGTAMERTTETVSPAQDASISRSKDRSATRQVIKDSTARFTSRGLQVESADGDFRFELGGRLLIDAAWYDEDKTRLDNESEIRSSRLSLRGNLWDDWQFKSEVEFAQDGAELKSNYLRYRGFKPLLITLGNFKEPFGLERWTSISETTFMERAAVSGALAPARSLGLGLRSSVRRWSISAGLFGDRDLSRSSGDDSSDEQSRAVTGRVTYLPLRSKTSMLHTGLAASYRVFDEGQIRFKARPESHLIETPFIDTGNIKDVDEVRRFGAEAAAVIGPWSLQAEYIKTETHRNGDNPTLDFSGWYVYTSYLLTGESRPYRHQRGVYRGIAPKRPLNLGGAGAWELALRYSRLDLTDEEVVGGELDLFTLGLNWYPNVNVRLMANYIHVLNVDRPGSVYDGDGSQIFQIRSQLDF
ncbi:MAG: porin [Gammaproteobacteria bacterium]|nr:porin [Gammaproteobacteria bacterium]